MFFHFLSFSGELHFKSIVQQSGKFCVNSSEKFNEQKFVSLLSEKNKGTTLHVLLDPRIIICNTCHISIVCGMTITILKKGFHIHNLNFLDVKE